MVVRRLAALMLVLLVVAAPARAQQATQGLDIKYVRDSEEYATLARQVYRAAGRAVEAAARQAPRGRWAVVLDVDETTLDNSAYQLERGAYGQAFSDSTWDVWTARRAAGMVPGVREFVVAVRALGGHVVYLTDRKSTAREDTRVNLEALGLWSAEDLLCTKSAPADSKGERRATLAAGAGACAYPSQPMAIVAFIGDQLGDFPRTGENDADAGNDTAFGSRFFLLPNPMYGSWSARVTRRSP
jgi:5'-nucleotidase (lipoprotein e(P4) family)